VVGAPLPDDVVDVFRSFLAEWEEVASPGGEFLWSARAKPAEVLRVVEHWAAVDAMDDEQLAALGVAWSPPAARPFFEALTEGVLDALRRHDQTQRLAERLSEQWGR
jgi:hypothetical protein